MNVIDQINQKLKQRLRSIYRKVLLLDKLTETLMPADKDEVNNPANLAKSTIIAGIWIAFIVFGIFGLWSALAPLDSSAIAAGKVVVDTNRKVIDHLEGGIVEEIMVDDGQLVEKGQPLVRLREISAKARMELLRDKYYLNLAMEARLVAEREGHESVTFPEELLEMSHLPEIAEIIDNQQRIFKTRTENVRGQINILQTRISQHQQEIKGLEMQAESMKSQIELLNQEIAVVKDLVEQGNATRPRLLSLQRQAAELQGRQGEYLALKAKAQEAIDETKLAMLNTESDYLNKVVEELEEVQSQIADLRERMTASADILERVVIRSPDRGIVNDLSVHTIGGVVKPGEKILTIIPMDDKLIVEARVSPQDIDVVRTGLPARVRLSAYKVRQVPMIDGTVVHVSADQFTDERTGESYFISRVEIDARELEELNEIELYPGMPAEVYVITGSRTFLAYMMDPITDSFRKSFRQE